MTKIKQPSEMAVDNLIGKCVAGSYAYGTNIETSDEDFRGIFVADPIYTRTPFYTVNEVEDTNAEDTKIYELNKFMKLCLDCNPNILELIWIADKNVIFDTEEYQLLRKSAPNLLSAKAAYTFTGYAMSQLLRIKNHSKWIGQQEAGIKFLLVGIRNQLIGEDFLASLQPWVVTRIRKEYNNICEISDTETIKAASKNVDVQLLSKKAPRQINYLSAVYSLTDNKKRDFDPYDYIKGYELCNLGTSEEGNILGIYENSHKNIAHLEDFTLNFEGGVGVPPQDRHPIMIIKYNKTLYNDHKDRWNKYKTWKENRNETRAAMEEHFGFDGKHASHLVRLLTMGKEILEEGIVRVERPDAELLKGIRAGEWTLEEVVKYAEVMDNKIRKELITTTKLRSKPDIKFAAELILEIQDTFWKRNI